MLKLLSVAALAAIGCSTSVIQAPTHGLHYRSAKQYPEEISYPPPTTDEDISADALPEPPAPAFSFQIQHSTWPGTWITDEPEDGVLRGVNVETRCQATVILLFEGSDTAEALAAGISRNVLADNFGVIGPVRAYRAGTMAVVDFSDSDGSVFGRLTTVTHYGRAAGLHAHVMLLCPTLEPVDAVSMAIVDSVKIVPK